MSNCDYQPQGSEGPTTDTTHALMRSSASWTACQGQTCVYRISASARILSTSTRPESGSACETCDLPNSPVAEVPVYRCESQRARTGLRARAASPNVIRVTAHDRFRALGAGRGTGTHEEISQRGVPMTQPSPRGTADSSSASRVLPADRNDRPRLTAAGLQRGRNGIPNCKATRAVCGWMRASSAGEQNDRMLD